MTYVAQDGDVEKWHLVYNADGSYKSSSLWYRPQNGVFTKGGEIVYDDAPAALLTLFTGMAKTCLEWGEIVSSQRGPENAFGKCQIGYDLLEGFRYLVATDQCKLADVEKMLGDKYVIQCNPVDFAAVANTYPASVGATFFYGGYVSAVEFMHKTFPSYDDSALMATLKLGKSMLWSIPTGQTALQAALADWKGATPVVYNQLYNADWSYGGMTIDNTLLVNTISTGNAGTDGPTYTVTHTTNALATHFDLQPTAYADSLQKVYIAFFNRPADPAGFNYWYGDLMANGGDVNAIAKCFEASPEYQQTYAGMSISQRIDTIYQNLFGRAAEPVGLKYWVDQCNSGKLTIGNIAWVICNGTAADATVVANKVEVAKLFTAALDNTTKMSEYAGQASFSTVKTWMKTVGMDHATVATATAKMPDVLKMIAASGTLVAGTTGDTITLTDVRANSILSFSAIDAGKVDKVIHWNADKIDVSGFDFATAAESVVTITGMTQQVKTTTAGFFHGAGVAIEKVGADSWVYVDSDHNGNFNPTTDVTIQVVGATVVAGDILF